MKIVKLGDILTESKVESTNPDPNRRITVKLFLKGIEKRPFEAGVEGGTKYYTRKAGQFIYGKQNLFKGAFGIIPDELDGFDSSSDIPAFDVRKDCLPDWIYYYLKQGNFYLSLESIATGTGSRRIQPSKLFEIEIPLPSITEQKIIIANAQSTEKRFDSLISELQHQTTLIKKLRQSILQEAVQGKLVPQNPKDEHAKILLEKIKKEKQKLVAEGKLKKEKPLPPITKDEIPFELPKGWIWCRLGEIGQINPRNYFDDTKEVSFVPMTLISSDFGIKPKFETRKWRDIKSRFTHFADNDVAIAKITPCFENSKAAVFKGLVNGIGAGTTELHIFRGDNKYLLPEYVYLFIKTPKFLNDGESKMTGSAGQKRVPTDYLKNIAFPLPPLSEQHRIVKKVDELMGLCDELEKEVQTSKLTTEKLMQSVLKEAFQEKEVASVV